MSPEWYEQAGRDVAGHDAAVREATDRMMERWGDVLERLRTT